MFRQSSAFLGIAIAVPALVLNLLGGVLADRLEPKLLVATAPEYIRHCGSAVSRAGTVVPARRCRVLRIVSVSGTEEVAV